MAFAKTFLISLVAFIALNIIFFLIAYGIADTLEGFFDTLEDYPSNILVMLFGPIYAIPAYLILPTAMGPEMVLTSFILTSDLETEQIILLLGWIVAPLIAAILSGYLGENQKEKIGGWFLTILLIAIITAIWVGIELDDLGATSEYIGDFVGLTIGSGFILGIFYSFFALIVPRKK